LEDDDAGPYLRASVHFLPADGERGSESLRRHDF
jgi:hypothetical protein